MTSCLRASKKFFVKFCGNDDLAHKRSGIKSQRGSRESRHGRQGQGGEALGKQDTSEKHLNLSGGSGNGRRRRYQEEEEEEALANEIIMLQSRQW
eukprot:scaffold8993_cov207-Skeletonema_marinoi.AAC.2